MRPASGSLISLLNSQNVYNVADLLTITFWDASVLRLTNSDINLVSGGFTFLTSADNGTVPMFKRGKTRLTVGLEVDSLDVTLLCGQSALLNGTKLVRAAINGAFDGATVKLERLFMPTWGDTSYGSIILFEGNVAGITPSSSQVKLVVKSELESLNVAMPRNCFTPACMNRLYDSACGVNRASLTVTGNLTGVTSVTQLAASSLGQAADYFTLGTLVMNTGPAAGSRRAVKAFSGGVITLSVPLPSLPAIGNNFSIYPGCSRTMAICQSKFSNQTRFRGTPFVPRPETAR